MAGQFGVDNTMKILNVVLELGNVADYIGRHPELGTAKFVKLTDMFDELMALSDLSSTALKAEVKELDKADIAKLQVVVKEKLNLEDDVLEGKIEQGLDLAIAAYALVEEIIAYSKSFKKEAPGAPTPEPSPEPAV